MTNTKGFIDIHVHADPSLFPRNRDAWDLAKDCEQAAYKALVLKFHHGSSVEIARILDPQFSSLKVFGGIVLNQFVGGLNLYAVESAVALGAKIVWLPTIHAQFHETACGCLGGFSFQEAPVTPPQKGISIIDDKGDLLPEIQDILEILKNKNVVLATGHISKKEIIKLNQFMADQSLDIPLLVNHVFFSAPKLSLGDMEALARPNLWFEVSHLSVSPITKAAKISEVAKALSTRPDLNWILVSDSGQEKGKTSPEALSEFVTNLRDHGVNEKTLHRYVVENPANLLKL